MADLLLQDFPEEVCVCVCVVFFVFFLHAGGSTGC